MKRGPQVLAEGSRTPLDVGASPLPLMRVSVGWAFVKEAGLALLPVPSGLIRSPYSCPERFNPFAIFLSRAV
jgi:hypothetical protein